MTIDTSGFERAARALQSLAQANAQAFGQSVARVFEHKAKRMAAWTDRRGNARAHLFGSCRSGNGRVTVRMGGSAPNYKRGPGSAQDYMEYLEFDHGGEYAIIYPTFEDIREDVEEQYGRNAIQSGGVCVYRDKAAARLRSRRRRAR